MTDSFENRDSNKDELLPLLQQLRDRINNAVIGQPQVVDQVLIALLAGGHVLVEGVPGLGKTLLVRTLAETIAGNFRRVQFTPDLMPADITGHTLYDMNKGTFQIRKGPVFTNLLLADEINRAPAKTQAALLEVMQEHQVSIEGTSHKVSQPFMVMATQNPIEHEGTYPLPEAELDRFLLKVFIDYPSVDDEALLTRIISGCSKDTPENASSSPVFNAQQIEQLQQIVATMPVDNQVVAYAVRLVRATRESVVFSRGAGTRACIALINTARAYALLRGADFVLPDDVKAMAIPVMRHRVARSVDMEIEGVDTDALLADLLEQVEAPRL
ncbi:MoxR family ATPase [Parendozoicomonas sp. Alg238-R29]|uniref:AAA family ATPase n=1 Tax=Parendozoicomonas sp. Alg238-R29 TaxID=2993446 RepID=UPI00248DF733|nr:MoxR family ATPase [Parendozoicomonas sp. Alg238-R29]